MSLWSPPGLPPPYLEVQSFTSFMLLFFWLCVKDAKGEQVQGAASLLCPECCLPSYVNTGQTLLNSESLGSGAGSERLVAAYEHPFARQELFCACCSSLAARRLLDSKSERASLAVRESGSARV